MWHCSGRLADLPTSAKLMITAFAVLIGCGYLMAAYNIYERHNDADLEPGLTLADLQRVYHGLERTATHEVRKRTPSMMERMVQPGAPMRRHLEQGGPDAVAVLTDWLADDAPQADFARNVPPGGGNLSPQQVLANQCVRCHNAAGGEMADVPYAEAADAAPTYELVAALAQPRYGRPTTQDETMYLAPTGRAELVHITHAHMLSMPVFALAVGVLFWATGMSRRVKAIIGPAPMVALCVDFAAWWLARPFEPAVYLIAVAGLVFALGLAVQLFCVLGALWFGEPSPVPAGRA